MLAAASPALLKRYAATFEGRALVLSERQIDARSWSEATANWDVSITAAEIISELALLADRFNSSVTPVRDALHRLVGEGLVASPRTDGFKVPILTEVGLRHLYAWSHWLLLRSLPFWPNGKVGQLEASQPDDAAALFMRIAGWNGNPEHLAAMGRINDRLRQIRIVEEQLLENVPSEVDELARAAAQDSSPLRATGPLSSQTIKCGSRDRRGDSSALK